MPLRFLRDIDRWIGSLLLYVLALPLRLLAMVYPAKPERRPRLVFLKLKGGGSLIIALPTLLGLRRKYPQAEFVLVCTLDAKIYAELTGVFDRFILIDDRSLITLAETGWRALRGCFHAALCLDLEYNSLLAAVFTMMTGAEQRMGLVKPEQPIRSVAYTAAISFNPSAPIYIYYDQICERLGGIPTSDPQCRATMRALLPPPSMDKGDLLTIGIAPFTSDFARERMMPTQTWIALLQQAYPAMPLRILIFGSARNQTAASDLSVALGSALPTATLTNLCGCGDLLFSAALLTLCHELWAVDSGLLHIARALGINTRSFWGPTMPSQRLRPMPDTHELVHYRPFICSPCIQAFGQPPCGGRNLCMISMAQEQPDLRPAWVHSV
jgi:ADP-heptose:LPS heptosyltransferase